MITLQDDTKKRHQSIEARYIWDHSVVVNAFGRDNEEAIESLMIEINKVKDNLEFVLSLYNQYGPDELVSRLYDAGNL